jgi:putative transposase
MLVLWDDLITREEGLPMRSRYPSLCGISEQTFYRWKKRYAGMRVGEARRPRVLEEENRNLKQLLADLSLDKQMLQDMLRKKLSSLLIFENTLRCCR